MKQALALVSMVLVLVACAPSGSAEAVTEIVEREVTRIVEVENEVPVEIEVTRLVEVEVPVEVEVTRIVEVEVTSTPPPPAATSEVLAMDAETVLAALADAGLTIGDSITFTAETDPNELLGRPGGYIGKITFRDTQLPVENQSEISLEDGGSIEVYSDEGGATLRSEYIQAIGAASPIFAEYNIQNGGVLLRLSKRLTPDQVEEYKNVIDTLHD